MAMVVYGVEKMGALLRELRLLKSGTRRQLLKRERWRSQ